MYNLKSFFLISIFIIQISSASDYIASLGLTSLPPVLVVATSNTMPIGLQTIDGVALNEDNRVLLISQTSQVQNGIWVVHPGNWTRPADFAFGSKVGNAFVLAISGDNNAGSNWICNTPNALIGTDIITFVEVHLSNQVTLANVGSGAGRVFQEQVDTRFNLRTIAAGQHMDIANHADNIVLSTDASDLNNFGAIVARDALGNFSAGTINANLIGNVIGNLTGSMTGSVTGNLAGNLTGNLTGNVTGNATTADTAVNFSGILDGDVGGIQSATVVGAIGGQAAANVASATIATNAATNLNTASTIVKRDASGNFAAGAITANLVGNVTGNLTGNVIGNVSGNATTAASATTAMNFSGSLVGNVTGTQSATVVSTVGGQTAANVASATTAANAATNLNTASAIVKRDGLGNFAAGAITANLVGNVTGNLTGNVIGNVSGNATTATSAATTTNFTGTLVGDVTGIQGATLVRTVGGQTAENIASATVVANAATNLNTASTTVKRDSSGNFATNMITINGTTTNVTDVATKGYVDAVAALGINLHPSALVVGTSNVVLSGLQTIDGVSLVTNNRVLLVSQTTSSQNGLWLVQSGAWIRPTDFAVNTAAGQAYVLITEGTIYDGSSWICSTPTSTIGTDGIIFVEFSLPSQTTATNVGGGAGQLFQGQNGVTLNFKTVATGAHLQIANNANDITLTTDATNSNTSGAIVSRDSLGNFAAGTITANLIGNVTGNVTGNLAGNATTATSATSATSATTATTATNFTGSLAGNVTGSQGATVVSAVGGQTAANVASATTAANAATNLNTASTIVKRDSSGNFAAGTITANLAGDITGAASLNVLKIGDVMSGALQLPAGAAASPTLNFTGSTTTGISAPAADTLSFDTGGVERLNISNNGIAVATRIVFLSLICSQSVQSVAPVNNGSVTVDPGKAILLLKHTGNRTNYTINFPSSPTDGQFFTIMLGTTNTITINNIAPGGATVVNGITSLSPVALAATTGGTSVTYMYNAADNAWYRYNRG